MKFAEIARAKINLSLRIVGYDAERQRHLLQSLVVFVNFADLIQAQPATRHKIFITGPRAQNIDNNIITRAQQLLETEIGHRLAPWHWSIQKNIPLGAGLGGGSADAAAALRMLQRHSKFPITPKQINKVAFLLGSDVTACLHCHQSQAVFMQGEGEELTRLSLPPMGIILAFPQQALATADIFAAYRHAHKNSPPPKRLPIPQHFENIASVIETIKNMGQDLQIFSQVLCPKITLLIDQLQNLAGCLYAGMTGSGSAVFGLWDTADYAKQKIWHAAKANAMQSPLGQYIIYSGITESN